MHICVVRRKRFAAATAIDCHSIWIEIWIAQWINLSTATTQFSSAAPNNDNLIQFSRHLQIESPARESAIHLQSISVLVHIVVFRIEDLSSSSDRVLFWNAQNNSKRGAQRTNTNRIHTLAICYQLPFMLLSIRFVSLLLVRICRSLSLRSNTKRVHGVSWWLSFCF